MELASGERTPFSRHEWMSIPWSHHRKTWRDLLYDILVRIADVSCTFRDSRLKETTSDHLVDRLRQLDGQLSAWHSRWLKTLGALDEPVCSSELCEGRSCVCSVPMSHLPDDSFLLLQMECWSAQLIMDLTMFQSLAGVEPSGNSMYSPVLLKRMRCVAQSIMLQMPFFSLSDEPPQVMTEGRCRSVLPSCLLYTSPSPRD